MERMRVAPSNLNARERAHDVQVYRVPAHRVRYDFGGVMEDIAAVLEVQRPSGGSAEP